MVTKAPTIIRSKSPGGAMAAALGNSAPFIAPEIKANNDQADMGAALLSVRSPAPQDTQQNVQDLVVGNLYELPLYRFLKSEFNARVSYDSEEVDKLSNSLRDEGQSVPAIGYVKGTHVVIIDGGKRFVAATSGGIEKLTVLIQAPPASARAEYEESRRINLERSTHTAFDDCIRWKEMLAKGIYTNQDDIAESMRVSKSTVSKIMSLSLIPERIARRMATSPSTRSLSTAYAIASEIFEKLGDQPDVATRLADGLIDEIQGASLNRNVAKELLAKKVAALNPAPARTRERALSNVVKYGEKKGTLKVFASRGQIDLSFKGLTPGQVEVLQTQIEQMLAGQTTL